MCLVLSHLPKHTSTKTKHTTDRPNTPYITLLFLTSAWQRHVPPIASERSGFLPSNYTCCFILSEIWSASEWQWEYSLFIGCCTRGQISMLDPSKCSAAMPHEQTKCHWRTEKAVRIWPLLTLNVCVAEGKVARGNCRNFKSKCRSKGERNVPAHSAQNSWTTLMFLKC